MRFINVFRMEVLISLWTLRLIAKRLVPSWRHAHADGETPFAWSSVARDPEQAYRTMLDLAAFGMVMIGASGLLVVGFAVRVLDFPWYLEPLQYWVVLAPVVVALTSSAVIYYRLRKLHAASGSPTRSVDLEGDPNFMIGSSIAGLVLAGIISVALSVALPNPSTW
ncbi:hypothetical protein MWU57_02235 [Isoptericola sp. S6320L]|uniref:hypothetical protein n=1 Tax=Isoptericola sp. S6320L TaxID=2926411 RepID=UPI001FF4CD80|nr:hypothetical protein [Isoptericola sp. S6320L]MCK0115838.1 hypothetical protein [Isoptericola sp. S6320L]